VYQQEPGRCIRQLSGRTVVHHNTEERLRCPALCAKSLRSLDARSPNRASSHSCFAHSSTGLTIQSGSRSFRPLQINVIAYAFLSASPVGPYVPVSRSCGCHSLTRRIASQVSSRGGRASVMWLMGLKRTPSYKLAWARPSNPYILSRGSSHCLKVRYGSVDNAWLLPLPLVPIHAVPVYFQRMIKDLKLRSGILPVYARWLISPIRRTC
jgi:hypothetical protein